LLRKLLATIEFVYFVVVLRERSFLSLLFIFLKF